MTPLMQNRPPCFPDQPGCFSGKGRFVSQGVEIIKDEISCLIRVSQDLRNWMRAVIKRQPKQAEQRKDLSGVVSAWDAGEERICRGAPHVIVVHGDKDYGFGAEDGALALSYLELFAPTLGLGSCWGGYFYSAVNAYPPMFEALDLPSNHRAFGAVMVGYAKLK